MALKTEKVFRSFVKGLITEASPLTFPENASVEEENFVLHRDGSRSRRLGLEYENQYQLNATGLSALQIETGRQSFHKWESPGGDTTVSIGVVRIVNKLWFLDLLTSNPSANLLNGGNPITIGSLANNDIETTVINNKFIIVSKDLTDPVILTYTPATQLISQTIIPLYVRDIWGVDDGLSDEVRPPNLTQTHKYNLRNQGWNENIVVAGSTADAIDYTKTSIGSYPANSDQWTLGKISDPNDANFEKYDPPTLEKNSTSRYRAPRGSIVIDAFNRGADRTGLTDVTTLPQDQEQGSISTVASYAQRVFYSGVESNVNNGDAKSPNYSGFIFFSRVVQSDDDLGACYQEADPTDPAINDLIDSDGGTIQIPEATRIVKIISSQSSLLVFAENGVWEIFGDTGGFVATSFQASKISPNGVLNAKSIVNVNGNFIYWSKAGIYMLVPDQAGGRFAAQSISLNTIQSLYLGISELSKNHCKGFYDEKENRVRWLYNDNDVYDTDHFINSYTKELILDLTLEAWSLNSITSGGTSIPYIADYVEIPGYAVNDNDTDVLVGADPVLVTSNDEVIITEALQVNRSSLFSYLTIVGTNFTISKNHNSNFVDWETYDGTGFDYQSFIVTGYELFNDIMREKQAPYIFFYFTKTEDGFTQVGSELIPDHQSSCLVQAQWNWTNSANAGKWGTQFQAYRIPRFYTPSGAEDIFDTGDHVITTKNKIRGSGKALSLKITSESGKDMKLLGWALPATAKQQV